MVRKVAAARPGIDPQELPEPGAEVLGVVLRVVRAAPVAEADVEHAVRSELELASLVVEAPVRLTDHVTPRARLGAVRVGRRATIAVDA